MLLLKRGGVLHIVLTAPPVWRICVLLTHLFDVIDECGYIYIYIHDMRTPTTRKSTSAHAPTILMRRICLQQPAGRLVTSPSSAKSESKSKSKSKCKSSVLKSKSISNLVVHHQPSQSPSASPSASPPSSSPSPSPTW